MTAAPQVASSAETPVPDVLLLDETKSLLEAGRSAGKLTTDQIALALDELDLEPGQADELYAAIDELQIEVVDGSAEEADEGPELDEEPAEVSTDTLQLFLKDIGKVPLLTAAQEVELAKRIERGDHSAKQAMSRRTSASSSRSPSATGTRACRSST